MKCRICGCTTPTGTKLCKDCAAARKRAFAATVTQPLLLAAAGAPSVTRPRFAPKPVKPKGSPAPAAKAPAPPVDRGPSSPAISPLAPKPAAERRTPAAVRRSPSRRSGFLWLFLAVFAGLLVLLLIGMFAARQGRAPGAGEPSDEVTPAPAAPPLPATASQAHVPAPPATPSAGLTADGLVTEVMPPPTVRKNRKPPAPAEVKTPLPEPEPALVVEPPPQPIPAPPRVVPPARVDPLQKLNEALARCARGDLLDRMNCEQNARSQLCGDSWGQIPQCPIGRGNDHGQ